MISFVFLALTYEPASESHNVVERANWREFGGRLREILRENDNFRWFLIARALTALSLTAVSFYTIYGIRRFDMSPELAGALTSVLLVANTLTSTVIGWIGDRWGHRRVLIGANLLTNPGDWHRDFRAGCDLAGSRFRLDGHGQLLAMVDHDDHHRAVQLGGGSDRFTSAWRIL